ncbi:head GIN domain-containing protein [Sphingomicrobium sp. XHP0239]|uniref:head GIN domain-containing protein n=1 Tax=Sphingomicrobium maritimum TaxID=3133972 RepID=UPI0031CCB428
MMIKLPLLAAALLPGAITSCVGTSGEDGGAMTTRVEQVAAFERLSVGGNYDVIVTTGNEPGVTIEGPENILDDMIVEVEGDLLRIRQERSSWNWRGNDDVDIAIRVPMLKEVAASGASDIQIDRIETERFSGELSGAGEIDIADVTTDDLLLALSGAGELNARGTTRNLRVGMSGAGEFNGAELTAENADLRASGAGSIRANVTGKATGGVSGAGDVTITGGADCDIGTSGAGSVECS